MTGIELDGYRTHSSTAAIAADRQRQRHLEANGWYIIRFGGQEVFMDVEGCVREAASLAATHKRR
jgi:very-short-patch-repair endonuclease